MRRLLLAVCLALAFSPFTFAQGGSREVYTALAVNMNHTGVGAAAQTVQIVVDHWTPAPARQRLIDVLMHQGPEQLLEELKKQPRVGYIRTPDSIGYDLHYASRTPTGDGGERVVLATDRPIGFWEAIAQTRTLDYPFTVIELHIKPNGEGEGKMSLATRITADPKDNLIVLENYSQQPVLLQSVKREKKSN
jgi:hypothetical protein